MAINNASPIMIINSHLIISTNCANNAKIVPAKISRLIISGKSRGHESSTPQTIKVHEF